MKKRKPKNLQRLYNNITYPLRASMARRRFWMNNALFPKTADKKNLRAATEYAFENDFKILELGCGDKAQALVDLRNLGFDNLWGVDLNPPRNISGINLLQGDITKLDLEDDFVDGVVYSSYVLPHLSTADQFKALDEIDRITAKGSYGFIGPLNPQVINRDQIPERFRHLKNPFFGYVKEKNKREGEKWLMSRKLLSNLAVYSSPSMLDKMLYKQVIPFYMYYFLTGRSMINRIVPILTVHKDYKPRLPFEYYITFKK